MHPLSQMLTFKKFPFLSSNYWIKIVSHKKCIDLKFKHLLSFKGLNHEIAVSLFQNEGSGGQNLNNF